MKNWSARRHASFMKGVMLLGYGSRDTARRKNYVAEKVPDKKYHFFTRE